MLEQALLREQFETLLSQEREILRAYSELLARVSDPTLREQVEQLHHDKLRHVELTERLLEIVD